MTGADGAAVASLGHLPAAGHRTAQQTVADALRQAILSGRLQGGTRLVQADIAAQLGTSSTPVREAMRELATEGLIRFDSYRGAVVHTPTVEEMLEVHELSLLLEPLALRKAARNATPAAVARLRALIEAMRGVDDVGEYVQLNRDLHLELHAIARSPRLAAILRGLHDTARLQAATAIARSLRGMRESDDEHAAIVDAVAAHDADLAAGLIAAHVRQTLDAVHSLREDNPPPGRDEPLP